LNQVFEMPQRARAMDWGLRGVEVIDVDGRRRGDHVPHGDD
jgi:hypothetical protein